MEPRSRSSTEKRWVSESARTVMTDEPVGIYSNMHIHADGSIPNIDTVELSLTTPGWIEPGWLNIECVSCTTSH